MVCVLITLFPLWWLALGAPMPNSSEVITDGSTGNYYHLRLERRDVVVPILDEQVEFVTVTESTSTQVTMTETEIMTVDASPTALPFLVVPPPRETEASSMDLLTSTLSTTATMKETLTVSDTRTMTLTEPPETVTVTAPPTTITRTVTPSESTSSSYWATPSHYVDLEYFGIKNFATGKNNLDIVDKVPTWAEKSGFDDEVKHSMLQTFYPEGSINPGNKDAPIGGSEFYATPLSLSEATNVTLEYSVFFPQGFRWVLGGKLPGLYGGHMSCSGGNDAKTCFSTRMMWRSDGAGELYLYAPKDKQTHSLCNAPPESHCNADYGLSIGRGSFYFETGSWTRIRQTIRLNTPGEQDGGLELEVNDQQIMRRDDIFYRDIPSPSAATSTSALPENTGGLLGPILGGIWDAFGKNWRTLSTEMTSSNDTFLIGQRLLVAPPAWDLYTNSTPARLRPLTDTLAVAQSIASEPAHTSTDYVVSTTTSRTLAMETPSSPLSNYRILSPAPKPIGFSGLFFSTFFGGNSDEYASPKDQYTWFKDFSITIHA